MIRYYKLFDMLNRKGMKKSDLRAIISSKTVAKLSKGLPISGESIYKICMFLKCQPYDIMEFIFDEVEDNDFSISKSFSSSEIDNVSITSIDTTLRDNDGSFIDSSSHIHKIDDDIVYDDNGFLADVTISANDSDS